MWIFTRDGFYSVVQYDPKADKRKNSPFLRFAKVKGSHVLVRSRVKEHLEALRKVVPNVQIEEDHAADYMYRAVVPRSKWKKFVADEIDSIDYGSHFKEVVRDAQPANLKGPVYKAMMEVWSSMFSLQPYTWSSVKGAGSSIKTSKAPASTESEDIDEWLTGRGYAGWGEKIWLADACRLLIERGKVSFTDAETSELSESAYELYAVLETEYGIDAEITQDQVETARDEVLTTLNDFYAKDA